jgi:hypothetical protein
LDADNAGDEEYLKFKEEEISTSHKNVYYILYKLLINIYKT